ncbi:hypothetical protein [Pseudomonas laurylsulfatiphila]
MGFNDDACELDKRGALESIASKLAPTEEQKKSPAMAGLFVSIRISCL